MLYFQHKLDAITIISIASYVAKPGVSFEFHDVISSVQSEMGFFDERKFEFITAPV